MFHCPSPTSQLYSTGSMILDRQIRIKNLTQTITSNETVGNVTNTVTWDYAEDGDLLDCHGTLEISNTYEIDEALTFRIKLDGHKIRPIGKKLPNNFQRLVALLQRSIPPEIFDPNETEMDTTYLDSDLRICNSFGERFNNVRNIFIKN